MKSLAVLVAASVVGAHAASTDSLEFTFESLGGVGQILRWQTESDCSYDLWFTDDLTMEFTQIAGFPRDGDGGLMEHPFTAGARGFFEVRTAPAGMIQIPAGSFLMGDNFGEGGFDELPVHSVEVGFFYMARHEVTKALWDEVRAWGLGNGYTDLPEGGGKAADHPVHSITWYEAVKWCNARSEKEQLTPCYSVSSATYRTGLGEAACDFGVNGYRLPTEAEWELAARGDVEGARYPWGTDTVSHAEANYHASGVGFGNQSGEAGFHPAYNDGVTPYTSPVGSFAPTGRGLYDMAGNVWEWCWDYWEREFYSNSPATDPEGPDTGTTIVFRGGSWFTNFGLCRIAERMNEEPSYSRTYVGFRLARTPEVAEGR